jgi:hypothetical protein
LKNWLILLISLAGFSLPAQNLQETVQLADSLFARGQYDQALLLYERVHYFDSSGALHNAYSKIAACYFYEKQYGQSADFYTLALLNQNDLEQEKKYTLKKASALIKSGNFLGAREELLFLTDTQGIGRSYLLLMGISYFGSEEEEKSKPYFLELLSHNKTKQQTMLDLFQKLKKINRKNPNKATFMSRVIPGMGQMYAGDFKSGIHVAEWRINRTWNVCRNQYRLGGCFVDGWAVAATLLYRRSEQDGPNYYRPKEFTQIGGL